MICPLEKVESKDDNCKCMQECPEEKMDFTFGKSCQLGTVRCCNYEFSQKKEEVLKESLPLVPYTFTSTAATPKEIDLSLNENIEVAKNQKDQESEKQLDTLEPLTFTSKIPKEISLPRGTNFPESEVRAKEGEAEQGRYCSRVLSFVAVEREKELR